MAGRARGCTAAGNGDAVRAANPEVTSGRPRARRPPAACGIAVTSTHRTTLRRDTDPLGNHLHPQMAGGGPISLAALRPAI